MKEWLELRPGWLSSDGPPAYFVASDAETSCNADSLFARPLSEVSVNLLLGQVGDEATRDIGLDGGGGEGHEEYAGGD